MWTVNKSGIIARSSALDSGFTDADIKNAVRGGELVIACRGAYVPTAELPQPGWRRDQEIYRRRSLAAAEVDDTVLTHQSAAAVHRLALLKPDLQRIHVGVTRSSSGKRRPTRHIHCGLDPEDVVVIDGILVTSLARTAVDVAIAADLTGASAFAGALAVFDSALRAGATREELQEMLDRRRRRGAVRARQALRHADGDSANPGESWSRAQMIEGRLPKPLLQRGVEVFGDVYYSDYEWSRLLIGEFDGEGKYLTNRRPGETIAEAVMREKRRENALKDMGFDVVRWDWPILERNGVVAHVSPHLHRAGLL